MTSALPIGILGTGSYLPGDPVAPDQVERVLGAIPALPARLATRAERIGAEVLARAGVRRRYYALDPTTRAQTETNASMAERAIRKALEASGEVAETIGLLVCASPMADYYCPPTSALVQERLGIERCVEIEIHSNCTGGPKALQVALDMLRTGRHRRAAVVYTQLSSTFLRAEFFNPETVRLEHLALRWMLSDGAGAMVLDRDIEAPSIVDAYVESRGGARRPGMIGGVSGALAHEIPLNGHAMYPALHLSGAHHVWQDIGVVNRDAPRHLLEGLKEMLDAAGMPGTSVTQFLLGIPGRHFMTDAMTALFAELTGADPSRVAFETEEFGYCGGATTFIQFDRLFRRGHLHSGEVVAAYLEESSKWMSGGFIARA